MIGESRKTTEAPPRLLAFYLPQFHPIPENDAWWGQGFTEWTNVARAKPLFRGHYQPHLPADLGYYDLRVPEVRERQAALARQYGIHAFCYYHYWFHGKRLLQRPFQEVLDTGRPDFPFCLCWANEPWSRQWLGQARHVLMDQRHSPEDDRSHARWLCRALEDPRYFRVRGRPVLLVYHPALLPEPQATAARFREEVERAGLPDPWLVGVDAHCPGVDFRQMGFDAVLKFQPQLGVNPGALSDWWSPIRAARNLKLGVLSGKTKVYDDRTSRQRMGAKPAAPSAYPCVYVGWDNSPRRGKNGIVFINGSPEVFQTALKNAMDSTMNYPHDERLVFVNGWNEWAEGNHLEPDLKYGHAYLRAVREALAERAPAATATQDREFPTTSPPRLKAA